MLKEKQRMQKQLKTNSTVKNNDKALTMLASFLIPQNENVRFAQESVSVLAKNISIYSETVPVLN